MTSDPASLLSQLAIQIPIVVAFMWFMRDWQKSQHNANKQTHAVWQKWFDGVVTGWKEERDEWRQFLQAISNRNDDARRAEDQRRAEERREMLTALQKMEQQLQHLTHITLLIYTHVTGETDIQDKLPDTLGSSKRGS